MNTDNNSYTKRTQANNLLFYAGSIRLSCVLVSRTHGGENDILQMLVKIYTFRLEKLKSEQCKR